MLYLLDSTSFLNALETRNCSHCITLVEFSPLSAIALIAAAKPNGQSPRYAIAQLNSQIVLSFQTKSYDIKIYRVDNRLLMDVYNKKTSNLMLNSAPVETASSPDGTGYWHRNKGKFIFRVYQRTDGRKWITINPYGQAVDEIWESEIQLDN